MVVMSNPLYYSLDLAPCDLFLFPRMKQGLKLRRFADVAKVQQESLAAHDSIFVEDFRHCFPAVGVVLGLLYPVTQGVL